MKANKYLFTPCNVPRASIDTINLMNSELIDRLTIVAMSMYEHDADPQLFESVSEMVVEEIFCKYC